ncbi:MAG: hypothetical protein V1698_01385 [bacterium]
MFCKISPEIIAGLKPANAGPRPATVWDGYFLLPELGSLPVKMRFRKDDGEISSEKIYFLKIYSRRAGINSDGYGYAIDHQEFNFSVTHQSKEELTGKDAKINILKFTYSGKDEDIGFSPKPPEYLWRLEGKIHRGVLYFQDPSQREITISKSPVKRETIESFPVRVSAVGVEPLKQEKNSTIYLKYEVAGVSGGLYDKRQNRNAFGLLEVVRTTKASRAWFHLNLKTWDGIDGILVAGEITANEERTSLVVKKGEEILQVEYQGELI